MSIQLDDLPVDADGATSTAEEILCEDQDDMTNAVIILAQVDPIQSNDDGKPKYTKEQVALILKCKETLDNWSR